MELRNYMQEKLVDKFVIHKPTVQQESGAGEFMPTTVDLSPSVSTLTLSKAMCGPAVVRLSWMPVLSVASHALGSAQHQENHALQSIPTTAVQSTTTIHRLPHRSR